MENAGGKRIAIVGGGAAGLLAAIAAADAARACGASVTVTVYEADERVGRSILATGNGRCNFTNAVIDPALYRNKEFVASALEALEAVWRSSACSATAWGTVASEAAERAEAAPETALPENAVMALFEDEGLLWREEGQGRRYPQTGKASTLLDVVRAAARLRGVREACGCAVAGVEEPRAEGGCFTLRMADGAFERAEGVIVAVGGGRTDLLLPASIPYKPPRPVLGPLRTETSDVRALDNIRVRCALELRRPLPGGKVRRNAQPQANAEAPSREEELVVAEEGELLFRKYGVSGIAVFNVSRFAQPGDALCIDLAPSFDEAALLAELRARRRRWDEYGACCAEDVLRGMVLPLVGEAVCKRANVDSACAPCDDDLRRIAANMKEFRLIVEGIGDARQCQVHRGGVDVRALDERTMGVRGIPGLYVAGEAADVDAPCGGFNLHWAWASGMLAGRSCARFLLSR